MHLKQGMGFRYTEDWMRRILHEAGEVAQVGEWQAIKNPNLPQTRTIEATNIVIECSIPSDVETLQSMVEPNLPWAEEHFHERVSGVPFNPPPSHVRWPFAQRGNDQHIDEGQFSHTYPERMWPKRANGGHWSVAGEGEDAEDFFEDHHGIRFKYGDLDDVVTQLGNSPYTRQAYLPIWFPEDTGAVQGQRVPCTLGYHFLIRPTNDEGRVHCTYFIRSCDFYRHFRDDFYMAARLMQWVCDNLNGGLMFGEKPRLPGNLTMHMGSLHVFEAERPRLRAETWLEN